MSQHFFYVFCARLQNGTQKSYWKPNSRVLLSTLWILQILVHFCEFLLLCGLVSKKFTMFFRDSEVCLGRCDSNGGFYYLKKNKNKCIWREICKRTRCPSIVTLALFLFIDWNVYWVLVWQLFLKIIVMIFLLFLVSFRLHITKIPSVKLKKKFFAHGRGFLILVSPADKAIFKKNSMNYCFKMYPNASKYCISFPWTKNDIKHIDWTRFMVSTSKIVICNVF